MTGLRRGLPGPIPARIMALPVSDKGYPVPFFVAKIDGNWDFRAVDPDKFVACGRRRLCWVCGQKLGRYMAFVIGPMCAVNRTSSEFPSHLECAVWSAKACPFLTLPRANRRTAGAPEGTIAGTHLDRNPGVALVWVTIAYRVFKAPGGVLIQIGEPVQTLWFAEGRPATREEIMESIDSGLPFLRKIAEDQDREENRSDCVKALDAQVERAKALVPT